MVNELQNRIIQTVTDLKISDDKGKVIHNKYLNKK